MVGRVRDRPCKCDNTALNAKHLKGTTVLMIYLRHHTDRILIVKVDFPQVPRVSGAGYARRYIVADRHPPTSYWYQVSAIPYRFRLESSSRCGPPEVRDSHVFVRTKLYLSLGLTSAGEVADENLCYVEGHIGNFDSGWLRLQLVSKCTGCSCISEKNPCSI